MPEYLELLSSIMASSVAGIITIDSGGVVESFSPGAERLFGYEASEVIGRNVKILMPDPYRNEHDGYLSNYQETGVAHIIGIGREVVALHKDGSTFPMFLSVGEYTREGRRMFTGMAYDMTAEVQARMGMHESLVRFEQLAGSMDEMFALRTSGTSELVYVSPAVERVYGLASKQVLANSDMLLSTAHPEDADRARAFFSGGLDAVPDRSELAYRIVRPDGTVRWLEALNVPVVDESGGSNRVAVTVRDVTARREAIDEITSARAEAEQANQAKNELLSRMSHELRTPLNAILGFAQLLEMDELTPDQDESVRQILSGGRHLLELINEVLDIARIGSGKMTLSLEPTLVSDVVLAVIDLLGPLADSRGVGIEALSDEACHEYVQADQQRLTQVLMNLISNSIKYNRQGGKVQLSCSLLPDGFCAIRVSDTGIGISTADVERLFRPFDRLGMEGFEVEGTGVGLPLAMALTQAMGGRIEVVSTIGVGSTFTVVLPIAMAADPGDGEHGDAESALTMPDAAPLADVTVLHIDDNRASLRLVEQVAARRPRVRLVQAMNGQLGIDLALTSSPDLVLLDHHLPDMLGADVLRRLRAELATRNTPVVIVSADSTPGQIRRLYDLGASGYLTKPFNIDNLLGWFDNPLSYQLRSQ